MKARAVQDCFYFHRTSPWLKRILQHFGVKSDSHSTSYLDICTTTSGLELKLEPKRDNNKRFMEWEKNLPLKKLDSPRGPEPHTTVQKAAESKPKQLTFTRKRKRQMDSPVAEKDIKRGRGSPIQKTSPSIMSGSAESHQPHVGPIPDGRYASPDYSPDRIEVDIFRGHMWERKISLKFFSVGRENIFLPVIGARESASGKTLLLDSKPGEVRELFGKQLKLEDLGMSTSSSTPGNLELSFPIENSQERFTVDLHRIG